MSDYDYVVVGGGSAGCVVAGRLSEDPSCRVLLLEAGRSDRTTFCKKPGMISLIHTIPQIKKKFDWGYYTEPNSRTLERKIPYARGKVLGGSSAINGMVFVRGNRANFDAWAAEGCDGWSYDDVLPYFKRMETFSGSASDYRGDAGPVQVTLQADVSPASSIFREVAASVCGVAQTDDYNGAEQEGFGLCQMNLKDGVRSSTAEAYIHPVLAERDNLDVEIGAHVRRVVIDNGKATGVEVGKNGSAKVINASTEVILSSGVIGSAQILMTSGVGPAEHLQALDIDVAADLPVGQNLHDHLFVPLVFLAPEAGHRGTARHFFWGMMKEYTAGGTWFGKSVFEVLGFVKTDASQSCPNLQIHSLPWAYPAPNQDAPGRPVVDLRPAITVQPTLIYPESRGEMRLRSADPDEAPIIDPCYLDAQADRDTLMRGIEIVREIMNADELAGAINGEIEPGPSFADAKALAEELPKRVHTVYHPVGTCRMGSDERAVVDPELRVRGIENLRVADAAIMPSITGGNTNAPAIMIGEKAADLIRGSSAS